MTNPTFRFPSTDKFEAIDFEVELDEKTGKPVKAIASLLTASGQKLGLPFVLDTASFVDLATWAAEVATLLVPAGTVESYKVVMIKPEVAAATTTDTAV